MKRESFGYEITYATPDCTEHYLQQIKDKIQNLIGQSIDRLEFIPTSRFKRVIFGRNDKLRIYLFKNLGKSFKSKQVRKPVKDRLYIAKVNNEDGFLFLPDCSSMFLAAMPGFGKTNFIKNIIHQFKSGLHEIIIADSKKTFKPLQSGIISVYQTVNEGELLEFLAALRNIKNRIDSGVFSRTLIVLDEAHDVLDYKTSEEHFKLKQEISFLIHKLLKLGREFGVVIIVASQSPRADEFKTLNRSSFSACFYGLQEKTQSMAIYGDDRLANNLLQKGVFYADIKIGFESGIWSQKGPFKGLVRVPKED